MSSWLGYPITHGYITTYQGTNTDTPHYAVDIGTPFHTSVTALFAGTVISQREHIQWGTEVFIKPDDKGLPEYYYYHLDVLRTKVGQHLQQGQVIGLSGGQNSGGDNPTTRLYSTGPHTHVGFFTAWVPTQIGTRAYGPDITPYVQKYAVNDTIAPDNSNTPAMNGLAQFGSWIVGHTGISPTIADAISRISPQPFIVVALAVLGIGAVLILAVWFLLNGGL